MRNGDGIIGKAFIQQLRMLDMYSTFLSSIMQSLSSLSTSHNLLKLQTQTIDLRPEDKQNKLKRCYSLRFQHRAVT